MGLVTTSSPTSSMRGLPFGSQDCRSVPRPGACRLAHVDGEGRYGSGEAGAHVRAAADGGDPQVVADLVVQPAEAVGGQGGSGGGDALHRREVEVARGVHAGLAAGHDVGGGGAVEGGAGPFGDPPLGARVRVAGAAVVQDDRRSGQQAGDEEVPHHPAGRGVPEEAVLRAQVAVQAELLEVLDEDAALGLDDRLGQSGGTGGVEHPQRVVEGHLLEDRFRVRGGEGRPVQCALGGVGAEQGDVHDGAQGGQFAAQFGDDVAAVVLLAAVAVTVDGEQDDRFDLLEAVEDAAGAEIGRAGGPHAAHGRGGEEGDDGLRDVREVAADSVSGTHSQRAQLGREGADLAAQLGPGDGARVMDLVDVQEGRFVRAGRGRAQRVLGVVQGRAGEPLGARHRAVAQHARAGGRETDVEPLRDRFPEGVQLVHGPAVQRRVAPFGGGAVVLGGPRLELGDPCLGDTFRIRLPERLGVHGRHGAAPGLCASCASPRTCWGVRVTRLTGTMPCDRLLHQGVPHIVPVVKMWSDHG
ncbi:hypothetical protein SGRIM128S_00048 [Streptomyces griseomycini]